MMLLCRNAVRAGEADCVVLHSSGCTGAVHKLIHALGNIQVGTSLYPSTDNRLLASILTQIHMDGSTPISVRWIRIWDADPDSRLPT
jgi:hypothetical protein